MVRGPTDVAEREAVRLRRSRNTRLAGFDVLEDRRLLASDWQNAIDPLNVSGDIEGFISPLDALLIINELNQPQIGDPGTGRLPPADQIDEAPPPFLDVDGDGYVSPIDAIRVINGLRDPSYPAAPCDFPEHRMEFIVAVDDAPAAGGLASRYIPGNSDFVGDVGPFVPARNGRLGIASFPLDQDYAPDIISVSPATDEVLIFLDTPSGILDQPARYSSGGSRPITVAVGDFIASGASDIAVGHSDGTIGFLEGHGDGTFSPRPDLSIPGFSPILDLSSADWDRDGDLDLAVSGSSQIAVVAKDNDLLTTAPLVNGDFSQSLTGWSARAMGGRGIAGSVTASDGAARLQENDSFLVSLRQTFVVPPSPQVLTFDLVSLSLEDAPSGLPDAFEVSLLDADGNSLASTIDECATAFFTRESRRCGLDRRRCLAERNPGYARYFRAGTRHGRHLVLRSGWQ